MIKELKWDSKFYGFNIADLKISRNAKNLSSIEKFILKNNISLVQSCCDINDTSSITLLEKHDFHFVDLKISYALDINKIKFKRKAALIADEDDIPSLSKIAVSISKNSRYYHKRINRNKTAQLYKIWIEKAVRGEFDDFCLKIVKNKDIVGFLSVKVLDKKSAQIGLIAVAKKYQNAGFGRILLEMLFSLMKEKKLNVIKVVTQGKNLKAQNFFSKNGFEIKNIQSWYYKFTVKG